VWVKTCSKNQASDRSRTRETGWNATLSITVVVRVLVLDRGDHVGSSFQLLQPLQDLWQTEAYRDIMQAATRLGARASVDIA
jgi:hypothetical protein